MMKAARAILFTTVTLAFASSGHALPFDLQVDARSTFLHTDSRDASTDPTLIDLAAAGISAAQTIKIERLGAFTQNFASYPDGTAQVMTAVFSSSSFLGSAIADGSQNLARVAGAIAAGPSIETPATLFDRDSTDIPEDFLVGDAGGPDYAIVAVPVGARFLFVASFDSFYADNTDPNGDFAVRISAVPEPGARDLLAMGLVVGLFAKNSWKKKRRNAEA